MKKISFLLGAGFSAVAGCPTANKLSNMILSTSSSDFYISAGKELCKNPYRQPCEKYNMKPFEELLSLIRFYSYLRCKQFNYEDFYLKLCELSDCLDCIEFSQRIKSLDTFYQQLLCFYLDAAEKNATGKMEVYEKFKNYVLKYAEDNCICIHTLNHDTLLERILDGYYSDGFSKSNSLFYSEQGDIAMYSKENFQGNVLLYKLHGSLDRYRYTYQKDYSKYEYVKVPTGSGIDTESIRNRKDIDKPYLQYIVPDFLTGTTSKILRYQEPFYQQQFEHFVNNLADSDIIYIIGYGGRDAQINEYFLSYAIGKQIIIIDPYPSKELQRLSDALGNNAKIIQQSVTDYSFSV